MLLVLLFAACTPTTKDSAATCDEPGGPVDGAADAHCTTVVEVDPAACTDTAGEAEDTGEDDDEYGETMYGSSGKDDECKYAVSWSSTDVCEGEDVTFTVTLSYLLDGTPVTGAAPELEGFMTDMETDVLSTGNATTTEVGDGVYTIGPVHFDTAGDWTIRFHIFGDCADGETSPHGHAAFHLNVP